jgi:hypothetical protein
VTAGAAPAAGPPDRERGSVTLLVVGCMAVAVLLILGTVVATSAQLARVRLLDVVDAAALDAADALDAGAYQRGLGEAVAISDATVWGSAESYLALRERPGRISWWSVQPGTGTPDGVTAVVVVSGRVELPVVGPLVEAVGGSVTISVTGAARAGLVG